MNRHVSKLIVGGVGVLLLLMGAYAVLDRPAVPESQFQRARALFETENYLKALQALRDIPAGGKNAAEVHAYLGAAYLRLHLYQAAVREFEESIRLDSHVSDPRVGLASTYISLGDSVKALDQARRAADTSKNSIDAWITLGRAQWLERNFGEAEKAALKIQELDAKNPQAVELLLQIYFDQNDAQKFQAVLDRTSNPDKSVQDLAIRFYVRGEQFRRANDMQSRFERADLERQIVESQLALKREPTRTDLYPLLVRNLVKVGRAREALDAAQNYHGPISLDVESGKANWLLGNNEESSRAYTRASAGLLHKLSAEVALAEITRDIRHWQEAFRAERPERDFFILAQLDDVLQSAAPLEKALIYRYAGLYDNAFYGKAAEQALAVLNSAPSDYDALLTIGTAYQRTGRLDDSARYLEIARMTYPNRAEPWARLGNLAAANSDGAKAMEYMQKAVDLEPRNATYLYNFGWAQDQLGNKTQAVSYYERAIAASPFSFDAMNNLALLQEAAGHSDTALKLLNRAVETDPTQEEPHLNLANFYEHRRSWREALEIYEQVLALNPANVRALVEMGRIGLELGGPEQAIESLNKALESDPRDFDAYMVLASAYERMGNIKEAIAALEEARRIQPTAPEIQSTMDRLKETGAKESK